jgi:hypothetical protein
VIESLVGEGAHGQKLSVAPRDNLSLQTIERVSTVVPKAIFLVTVHRKGLNPEIVSRVEKKYF